MSPNADLGALGTAGVEFDEDFGGSGVPGLVELLGRLGEVDEADGEGMIVKGPKKWRDVLPGKERKEVAMEVLAWVLGRGLVVRVATFALVRVGGKVWRSVVEELREHVKREDRGATIKSPPELADNSKRSAASVIEEDSAEEGDDWSLIPGSSPLTELEARCLNHLEGQLVAATERKLWPELLKYFDGAHALEDVAAAEGMKRKEVLPLLEWWERQGLLLVFRTW